MWDISSCPGPSGGLSPSASSSTSNLLTMSSGFPTVTTFPPFMNTARSQQFCTKSMSWDTTTNVSPRVSLARRTDLAMIALVMGSMVPVGSSRMMILGSLMSTCAKAILWHSPTEKVSG